MRTVGDEPTLTGAGDAPDGATLVLIDAPPGTSCPVIEAVRGADLVVLVTEPTPFGLNDLRLAVEMVRALGLPFVVAVNRADIGDDRVRRYCDDGGHRHRSLELPDDRRIAEALLARRAGGRRPCPACARPSLEMLERHLARRSDGSIPMRHPR